MEKLKKVLPATVFDMEMYDKRKANHMILSQNLFPASFEKLDKFISGDSREIKKTHMLKCMRKHAGTYDERRIVIWARTAPTYKLLAFVKDVLKQSEKSLFGGFRITVTWNKAHDHTLFFGLFWKNPRSSTVLFCRDTISNLIMRKSSRKRKCPLSYGCLTV